VEAVEKGEGLVEQVGTYLEFGGAVIRCFPSCHSQGGHRGIRKKEKKKSRDICLYMVGARDERWPSILAFSSHLVPQPGTTLGHLTAQDKECGKRTKKCNSQPIKKIIIKKERKRERQDYSPSRSALFRGRRTAWANPLRPKSDRRGHRQRNPELCVSRCEPISKGG
jgi:hypothetical protein